MNCRNKKQGQLVLVEIGSTREDVFGQGSTEKLATFCNAHDIHFITVDMDPSNIQQAQHDIAAINTSFQAVNQKAESFFSIYSGPLDFVFLDAYDYDHGAHSEERQSRYEQLLGARINDTACHEMHLNCVLEVQRILSPYGAICIDDTWFKNGAWFGKGTLAVPYLLKSGFIVVLSGNNGILMVHPDRYKGQIHRP